MASQFASPSIHESQAQLTYQQLLNENNELKINLETLLEYNNKLLGIIEDLNKNPSSVFISHQRCVQESKFLWKKLSALQSYSYQLEMELEQYRSQKHNQQQIEKQLKQVLQSNEIVQKKFESKIIQVLQQIQQIRGSQQLASERIVQFMQDRQQKVQQISDQFQYKDQIIQLLSQKVRLFQDQYGKKSNRQSGLSFRDQKQLAHSMIQRVSVDDKIIQTQNAVIIRKDSFQQDFMEQKRIIEIYQTLVRKVKNKLQDKII